MAAQLRLKYARSLEVLATLEAHQAAQELEAEDALAAHAKALAAANAALAEEQASVAALQVQLERAAVEVEAATRADTAEARAAALEGELASVSCLCHVFFLKPLYFLCGPFGIWLNAKASHDPFTVLCFFSCTRFYIFHTRPGPTARGGAREPKSWTPPRPRPAGNSRRWRRS